ncbi:MAG TPA: hypothetical protein VIN59_00125 [Alphaproteobacteria bacterium]
MTLNRKLKPIIATVVAIILILAVVALGKKSDNSAQNVAQPTTTAETASTPPATVPETAAETTEETTQEATTSANLSPDGLYNAECIVSGGGMMLGRVEVDEDDDPAKEETIEIKNVNTGKMTKVDMKDARCTFMPITKK